MLHHAPPVQPQLAPAGAPAAAPPLQSERSEDADSDLTTSLAGLWRQPGEQVSTDLAVPCKARAGGALQAGRISPRQHNSDYKLPRGKGTVHSMARLGHDTMPSKCDTSGAGAALRLDQQGSVTSGSYQDTSGAHQSFDDEVEELEQLVQDAVGRSAMMCARNERNDQAGNAPTPEVSARDAAPASAHVWASQAEDQAAGSSTAAPQSCQHNAPSAAGSAGEQVCVAAFDRRHDLDMAQRADDSISSASPDSILSVDSFGEPLDNEQHAEQRDMSQVRCPSPTCLTARVHLTWHRGIVHHLATHKYLQDRT